MRWIVLLVMVVLKVSSRDFLNLMISWWKNS